MYNKKMKNNIKYIILLLITFIWMSFLWDSIAYYPVEYSSDVYNESIITIPETWNLTNDINSLWFSLLAIVKLLLEWLLVIFIVYIWAQMIWSMWTDEEALSKSKRQIWYSVVALLFINIPWTLYDTFNTNSSSLVTYGIDSQSFLNRTNNNIFLNSEYFLHVFWVRIVGFLEIIIWALALTMIIYEGLKLISSRWREEKVTEAKNKVIYSILALVFVWIIEAWKNVAFSLNVGDATNIFSNLANLALFFAAPIAFFFLTLAAYYYITSAWDEEKVKKAKSIVINTILATIILLASYTFLWDLGHAFF